MRHKAVFYQSLFYLGPELLKIAAWPNCNNDILLQFFKGNKKQEKGEPEIRTVKENQPRGLEKQE